MNNNHPPKRIGKFAVTMAFVDAEPELVAEVLSIMKFVPTSVALDYATLQFDYVGISPMFAEVERYCIIPEYNLTIHKEFDSICGVSVKNKNG